MILIKGIKLPKILGIAVWPFVLVKTKTPGKTILNHERIHLRQQVEMLVLPFYFWYLFEWLVLYIKYRNIDKAYRNISFEKEAYKNESNMNYLKNRPFWNFMKYLNIK
ncbi:hypothetical protein [Lacihabitans soyangensis]|uniref:DUF4157 domain-containing protein n=1 Tax=Lacihabitans soyangensis TaxID=869394 RepID=A0AAE3KXA1_9BACT|nr:hypothetical protein [Lacihabitans soyangensis]MCP9764410.1 hypothetical protein [Lacihabitans soyangensis]